MALTIRSERDLTCQCHLDALQTLQGFVGDSVNAGYLYKCPNSGNTCIAVDKVVDVFSECNSVTISEKILLHPYRPPYS